MARKAQPIIADKLRKLLDKLRPTVPGDAGRALSDAPNSLASTGSGWGPEATPTSTDLGTL